MLANFPPCPVLVECFDGFLFSGDECAWAYGSEYVRVLPISSGSSVSGSSRTAGYTDPVDPWRLPIPGLYIACVTAKGGAECGCCR